MPIEPPAPVIITTSFERYAPTRSISMRTGSRPSTSSTWTSRTWRTTAPEPDWSSSKTVGSVRTGTPRSRAARTTRARSVPGADGIAIRISSGSASSRIRASAVGTAEHAHAVDARAALERVVVDEADRVEPELRVAQHLAQRQAPAVAGADDQHAARVLAARGSRGSGAVVDRPRDEAHAADEHERQQREQREHAGRDREVDLAGLREMTVTGSASATKPTTASVSSTTACSTPL